MTETGTQTWHELADRVDELESAIIQANRDYARDKPIHRIMDRLKKVENDQLDKHGEAHEPS